MKAMLRRTVEQSGKPLKAVASEIGMHPNRLCDATNPDIPEAQFQFRLLVPFMKATKSVEPLRWLAAEMNCAVVELPSATPDGEAISRTFLKVVDELGQDSAAIQRALTDGEISVSEGQTIAAELRDTIDALLAVEAAVLAKAAAKPQPARMGLPSETAERRRA